MKDDRVKLTLCFAALAALIVGLVLAFSGGGARPQKPRPFAVEKVV